MLLGFKSLDRALMLIGGFSALFLQVADGIVHFLFLKVFFAELIFEVLYLGLFISDFVFELDELYLSDLVVVFLA